MRALWARIALIVLLIGGSGLAATGAAAAPPQPTNSTTPTSSTGGALTTLGTDAVNDIRRCLSSKSTLNVYYLTDDSGSLGGPRGTDPQDERSQILANSLAQLSTLGDDIHVNWAAGFFSSNFEAASGWQPLTSSGPADLTQLIQQRTPHGATNWPAAIAGAQAALAAQQTATNGCSVLVWLTDGGIDLGGGPANSATNDAINALCGSKVTAGAAPPSNGIFNELRQSGVVVIGVLLKVNPSALDVIRMAFMRPLVESVGQTSTGETIHCGVTPIPSTYVHGALLEATAPNQLASVFVQLGAILGGGYQHPFDSHGGFQIDPGVDHFLVTTEGTGWSLVPPSGSGLATITAAAPGGAKVLTAIGASQIQVSTLNKADAGTWTLLGATNPGLYLFSGLTLSLSSANQLVAGTQSAITGRITRHGGSPVDLAEYKYQIILEQVPSNGGKPIVLGSATVDAGTGKFTLLHTASPSDGIIDIVATMSPLQTKLSSLTLADISTQQLITVALPTQFPRVAKVPVHLSTLVGASGRAKGFITLSSPPDGSAGSSVCFATKPAVVGDSLSRQKTWAWTVDAGHVLNSQQCVTLAPHSTKRVELSAANSVAAYSTVHAEIVATFRAKSGDTIKQRVPVQFATTKPLNLGTLGGAFLALLILGILLPLALLYLLNYSTTKLQRPRDLMRATIPATLAPDGVSGKNVDLASPDIGLAQFKALSPGDASRRFPADQLGEIRARVPISPFSSPWFEINPPAGSRIFAAEAGHVPVSKRALVATGRMATFGGDIGRVWAFVVTESELLGSGASGPISGTLFVYLANDARNPRQFTMRMSDVRVQSRIWERITKAKELIRAERPERKSKPPRDPRPDHTPPPPRDNGGPPPPPRRSPNGAPPPPAPRTSPYSAPPVSTSPAASGPPSPTRTTPSTGSTQNPSSAPPPPPPRQAGGPPPPPPRPRT